jgi:AcrR family transcriptional regulator
MGRQALSTAEIEGFRERLVEVATHLFARHGYEGVTLRAISEELGCSPMTPYRYFRGKDEIFAAVRSAAYSDFAAAQEAARASSPDPSAQLTALGRAYIRFALERPDAYRLMFELGQPDPDGYPELRDAELRAWAPLRGGVGAAVAAGALAGDPDEIAHVFWGGVHGVVSLHLAGKLVFGRSLETVLESMLRTLSEGNRGPRENQTE